MPCCSSGRRAAESGTSTARITSTFARATAPRCWDTAIRACARMLKLCPTADPDYTGIAARLDRNLVLVPYHRPDLLEAAFKKHAHALACIICEPVYYNAGCIIPDRDFMALARRLTQESGVLLIFDEVLS